MRRPGVRGPVASLVPLLAALASFAASPSASRIAFPGDSAIPRSVQEFAWRVIETRCNYQAYDRARRSFWAYDARARRVPAGVVYSIHILSDLPWKKSESPALINLTIVDDGHLVLTALTSSFVVCSLDLG